MSENLEKIKEELIKYGRIIDRKNFSPGTSGNVSVRYGEIGRAHV